MKSTKPLNTRAPESTKKSLLDLQSKFLDAFAKTGTILAASSAIGIERDKVYVWLKDLDFKVKFAEANKSVDERLETAGMQRAVNGVERPVYQGGKLVGTTREYSDDLLKTMLAARMPKKYARQGEIKIDVRVVSQLGAEVLSVIRKRVPDACPHCKTLLGIMPKLAEDMEVVSQKFNMGNSA